MKRVLIILCLAIAVVSCQRTKVDKEAVREAVEMQMTTFPESRLQDLYKSFFQDRFGPAHIIPSCEGALRYIESEVASAERFCGPMVEKCGWRGDYVRVNLKLVKDGVISAEQLTDALIESAEAVQPEDIEQWRKEWAEILDVIEKYYPNIPDFQSDKESIEKLLDAGEYVYHHSEPYSREYHPHYRIIKREILNSILIDK